MTTKPAVKNGPVRTRAVLTDHGTFIVGMAADDPPVWASATTEAFDPYAGLTSLLHTLCRKCYKRRRNHGELYCQPCRNGHLAKLQRSGYLQDVWGCRHVRRFDLVVPYWDEGDSGYWHDVERAYEDGAEATA